MTFYNSALQESLLITNGNTSSGREGGKIQIENTSVSVSVSERVRDTNWRAFFLRYEIQDKKIFFFQNRSDAPSPSAAYCLPQEDFSMSGRRRQGKKSGCIWSVYFQNINGCKCGFRQKMHL